MGLLDMFRKLRRKGPEEPARDLFIPECHTLISRDCRAIPGDPVKAIIPREDRCLWCKHPMTTLLDLDLTSPAVAFLGIAGQRLAIATCEACTCYTVLFTKVDYAGNSRWHPSNITPVHRRMEWEEWIMMPTDSLVLDPKPQTWPEPEEDEDWDSRRLSKVGGRPTWVQPRRKSKYPICPECQKPMMFISQIHIADIEEYGEGMYYMFLCRECGVAATTYQQT